MKNNFKFVFISIITCSVLLVASNIEEVKDFTKYPLSKDATSVSRGGSISDKIASEDGVGTILIGGIGNEINNINNKIYNQILKNNKDMLSDTTNLKDLNINNSDLNKINENKFVKLDHQNNTVCDDNNPLTVGETYLNDKCQGGTFLHLDGESCDDGNIQTINDKYLNGICIGITNSRYSSCTTYTMKYKSASTYCNTLVENGYSDWRLPKPAETSATLGINGIQSCNNYTWSFDGANSYVWNGSFITNKGTYTNGNHYTRCVR